MKKLRGIWILTIVLGFISPPPADGGEKKDILTYFSSHCVQCHGKDGKVKGKVNLLEITSPDHLAKDAELLKSIIDVIDFREMPPEDEDQLPNEVYRDFLSDLQALRDASVTHKPTYPATPIRRMNRFQYDNAVVDLFHLKSVVFSLPERMMREHRNYFRPETGKMADVVSVGSRPLGKSQMIEKRLAGVAPFPQDLRAEHGYDNRGDHISLSPLLMESFIKLARSIVDSHDFNPANVGIWEDFFKSPDTIPDDSDQLTELVSARLTPFLTRAFRAPVDSEQLNRYTGYTVRKIASGDGWTETMKSVAAAAISSPKFLYLYDTRSSEGDAERISSYDLASRLSFFLWGSIPDPELLKRAQDGDLLKPDVLAGEFERMLKDQKLKRFCDSFPSQWLQLERIISSTPDRSRYPGFYFLKYRDSMHMMLEPLLVFETVLIENMPVTQFLDSDFTYRSSLLQEAYAGLALNGFSGKGRNEVTALNFKRMPVSDRRSGGLITNAAVMTMTSGPERTQPITRGAWIAGVVFNNPPEPPPADVPALGEKPAKGEEHLTLRERLAAHRERSDCRGCHEQIDPLGFALENYDPIGNWRTQYENGREIDVAGKLLRQHEFTDVIEFKDALLAEKDRFVRGLAGHLLSFALARELSIADQPALDLIAERTKEDDYKFQTLLKEIILSEPFHTKNNP